MAKRAPSADSREDILQSNEHLAKSVEQLSDDINGLMEIAEQGTLLKELVGEIATLRSAIDDIRAEIEWASRNLMQARTAELPHRVTSMSVDPCDPEWAAKLNARNAADFPSDRTEPVLDPPMEHAMTSQNETVSESPVYCCAQPQLAWQDDPDAPSVVCQACGYVVAEFGSVVDHRAKQEDAFHKVQTQGRLWEDEPA